MAQNFVQDGVTLTAPVAAGVTRIYTGTPVYLSAGGVGAVPATNVSGIDGVSMNTCAAVADETNYITTSCIYQTEGVWAFKVKSGTTFVLGDDVFIDAVDNGTIAGTYQPGLPGERTTVTNRGGAAGGDVSVGRCVALGSIRGFGTTVGTDYVQVKIVTGMNSNIANK